MPSGQFWIERERRRSYPERRLKDFSARGSNVSEAKSTADSSFHGRALRRARQSDRGRPGVLAWLAGLSVHCAVVLLLVV
jgi:hypothetical protein